MDERIRVISPEGKIGTITNDKLNLAIQNGYQLYNPPSDEFIKVVSPYGKKGKIPKNNIDKALNQGYSLVENEGDSWPALIGKSALKGVSAIADIPNLGAQALEGLVNANLRGNPTNLYGQGTLEYNEPYLEKVPQVEFSKYIPNTEDIRKSINQYTGIDLEPHPTTGSQRIASNAAEFAGGMGLLGGLNKGANIAKNVGTGTSIGATSGALQEGGINPLAADLVGATTLPLLSASRKNILNKFSPSHRQLVAENKVTDALRNQIGEENLPTVLENIQKYKRESKPINILPTTPELAQDVGLSRLYRTQTNTPSIPIRHQENDVKLREALENVGKIGLEESEKGDILRNPFIQKLAKDKERRSRLTQNLYKELEALQEGIDPTIARNLLNKEIEVASPGVRSALEKYRKTLNRNELSPKLLARQKDLQTTLANIDKEYANLNPAALEQLKAPILEELKIIESQILPRPIQIENTIQELGDKVNSLSKAGENNAARRYGGIKKAYEEDLATSPVGLKHRQEYSRLSKPINEIETSNILNAFTKENKDINKLEGLLVPSEKLPQMVLKSDLPNTKILIEKSKSDPELLGVIKGIYIDELLQKSTLSSGNFSYDKANKFLNNKATKEKINIVFNNSEKAKLKQFLNTLEKRAKVETMGKVSGSDTHQKLKVDEQFTRSLNGLGKIIEKVALKATGTNRFGDLLLNTSKDAINKIKNGRSDAILERALLEPTYFKKLMKEERNPKTFKDFYNPLLPLIETGIRETGR